MLWIFCCDKFDSSDELFSFVSFWSLNLSESFESFCFSTFIKISEKNCDTLNEKWCFKNEKNDCEFFNFWILNLKKFRLNSIFSIFFYFFWIYFFCQIELSDFSKKLSIKKIFDFNENSFFVDFDFDFSFRKIVEFRKKIFNEKWDDEIERKKMNEVENERTIVLKKSKRFTKKINKTNLRIFF